MSIMTFGFMIIGSVVIFAFMGVVTDFKEKVNWYNILIFTPLGLIAVFGVAIIIQLLTGGNLTSGNIWNVQRIQLPPEPWEFGDIYIKFHGIATSLNITPNTLYDVLHNFLLVAPGEELAFRGIGTFIIGKLSRSPWVGGLVSTGIWATIHMIANPSYQGIFAFVAVMTAFIGGFFMLYMMLLSKDIMVAILVHSIFNSLVVASQGLLGL